MAVVLVKAAFLPGYHKSRFSRPGDQGTGSAQPNGCNDTAAPFPTMYSRNILFIGIMQEGVL